MLSSSPGIPACVPDTCRQGSSAGPRGPCRARPHWAVPASGPARGPAASTQRPDRDPGDAVPRALQAGPMGLRLTGLCHLRLDPLQPVAAQTPLQGAHLAVAVALWVVRHQPVHQLP